MQEVEKEKQRNERERTTKEKEEGRKKQQEDRNKRNEAAEKTIKAHEDFEKGPIKEMIAGKNEKGLEEQCTSMKKASAEQGRLLKLSKEARADIDKIKGEAETTAREMEKENKEEEEILEKGRTGRRINGTR